MLNILEVDFSGIVSAGCCRVKTRESGSSGWTQKNGSTKELLLFHYFRGSPAVESHYVLDVACGMCAMGKDEQYTPMAYI